MALKENLQNYLKKGVQASKEAFSKAETAVTKFGDESVLKIEKKQFEAKLRKEIALSDRAHWTHLKKISRFSPTRSRSSAT